MVIKADEIAQTDWREIAQYDMESRIHCCSVNGFPWQPEKPRIFRGPWIEQEGWFDMGQVAAEQLARLLGWVSPEQIEEMEAAVKDLQLQLELMTQNFEVADEVAQALIKEAQRD